MTVSTWQADKLARDANRAEQQRLNEAAAAEQARLDAIAQAQIEAAAAERARIDAAAQAQITRDNIAAAEQRRAERRAEKDQRKAKRKGRLGELGMSALWATIIVLPITIAWQAQADFAELTLHLPQPLNHGFPAAVETGAWLCAFEAHRRIKRGLAAGSLPRWMWFLASIAAAINYAHGMRDGGPVAGFALAIMSLLGVLLHSIRQGLDREAITGRAVSVWRMIRYPRLSWAATGIQAARPNVDAETAWTLAWIDRYGVGPDVPRRERNIARVVLNKQSKEHEEAAKNGEVTIIGGRVQYGYAPEVRAYIDEQRESAMAEAQQVKEHCAQIVQSAHDALMAAGLLFGPDQLREGFSTPNTAVEQVKQSPRASEMLPLLQAAITAGTVRPNPSVKRIQDWALTVGENAGKPDEEKKGLGTPIAMKLRDAVRGLQADQPAEDDKAEAA